MTIMCMPYATKLASLFLIAGLIGGCAAGSSRPSETVFYPSAPNPPRLQFLVALGHAADSDPDSRFVNLQPQDESSERMILKPYGLAFAGDKLYLCDTKAAGLWALDIKRGTRSYIELERLGIAGEARLANLALDGQGRMYVVDIGRNLVLLYNQRGRLITLIKDIKLPVDVAVYQDKVYILDMKEQAVQIWNKELTHLMGKVGKAGEAAGEFSRPGGITIGHDGCLYVADTGNGRVQKFDRQGAFLMNIGRPGDTPGHFVRPKGVATDRDGNVYVADAMLQNVQLFDPQGKPLLYFGQSPLNGLNLQLPAKIILDYNHIDDFRAWAAPGFEIEYLVLVSNQLGPNMVNIYGFGHQK